MNKYIFRRLPLYRSISYHIWLRGIYWFLKTKITRRPLLKYMDVALDYSCNMKCHHCFAKNFQGDTKKKLSIEQYRKIAANARSIGCLHVNLQGGEPLLIKNLAEYIHAFEPHLCHVSITTNGFLFSNEKAQMLKKAGINQVVFSLDSFDPQQHDHFRGLIGAYNRVVEGIMLARQMQFGVSVNVTVSHETLQSEKQRHLFDWFHKENIPYNPILACPVGAWTGKTELMVSAQDVTYINSLREQYRLAQRDIHSSWVAEGCSAISETLYLTPYGDVLPCPFIHISVGNVHEERIDAIWKRLTTHNIYGHYSKTCWVAENEHFAKDLVSLYAKYENLPIPHKDVEGSNFLTRYWGKKLIIGGKMPDYSGLEYDKVYHEWERFWKTVQSPTLIGKISHNAGEKIVKGIVSELNLAPDAPILDLGCGNGTTLYIFRELGFVNSIGIDNSKEAIKRCVNNGFVKNKDVFEMNALDTAFKDRQFTLVFSWGLLEHFQDYSSFLKEMARLSDRYILILQPNHFSLAGRISHLLAERFRKDNVKEYSYRLEEFIEAFEKVNFQLKVIKTTRFKKFAVLLFENLM